MNKKRRKKRGILLISIVVLALLITFLNKEFLRFYRFKEEYNHILTKNAVLRKENQLLFREIEALKKDKGYIEKIAREELGMVKKGEIVYYFSRSKE